MTACLHLLWRGCLEAVISRLVFPHLQHGIAMKELEFLFYFFDKEELNPSIQIRGSDSTLKEERVRSEPGLLITACFSEVLQRPVM